MSLSKPRTGEACNGCGLCCLAEICSAGSFTMGLVETYGERVPGPCPALVTQEDGRYACGMVVEPQRYSPNRSAARRALRKAVEILIGADIGCDEPDEGDPDAERKVAKVQGDFMRRIGRKRINKAVALWYGVKED